MTFNYTFPKTADKTVTNITVHTQPKLSYNIGDKLDLSALVLTVTYDIGSPANVAFANLTGAAFEIDGRAVVNSDTLYSAQNGKGITITYGGRITNTTTLTVYTPPVIKVWVTDITDSAATINFTHNAGIAALFDIGGSPVLFTSGSPNTVTLTLTANTEYKYNLVVTDNSKIFTTPISFRTLRNPA